MVAVGYFYFKSYSNKKEQIQVPEEYSNIVEFQADNVVSTQDYSENVDSTSKTIVSVVEDLGSKEITDNSYIRESLEEKSAVDQNINVIEPTPEKIEPTANDLRPAETNPLIIEKSNETKVNTDQDYQEDQADQEGLAQNGINGLKNKEDFQEIDPKCVETPVFHGGETLF